MSGPVGRAGRVEVVLVPGVLALLPSYAGLVDPVPDLRAACLAAVGRLAGAADGCGVLASAQGRRVAEHLADLAGVPSDPDAERAASLLVVANGTATRTEQAPGHLDERAAAYDDDVRIRLTADPGSLATLDRACATELWADVDSLARLGEQVLLDPASLVVDYDDAPYGVQYWVMSWTGAWR